MLLWCHGGAVALTGSQVQLAEVAGSLGKRQKPGLIPAPGMALKGPHALHVAFTR